MTINEQILYISNNTRADRVPVGEDQFQHLELARQLAYSFNRKFGHTFPEPAAMASPAARIMSLKNPTKKMSKSDPNQNSVILITDSAEVIERKVKMAMTDSFDGVTFDPNERPGVSNLLSILGAMRGVTPQELVETASIKTPQQLKQEVADEVVGLLDPIARNFSRLENDKAYVDEVIQKGNLRAREIAEETMIEVRKKIGI